MHSGVMCDCKLYFVDFYCVLCRLCLVKLAENESSSPCQTGYGDGLLSASVSVSQPEDVYEGISSPQCRTFAHNGLLRPHNYADVCAVAGNFAETGMPLTISNCLSVNLSVCQFVCRLSLSVSRLPLCMLTLWSIELPNVTRQGTDRGRGIFPGSIAVPWEHHLDHRESVI